MLDLHKGESQVPARMTYAELYNDVAPKTPLLVFSSVCRDRKFQVSATADTRYRSTCFFPWDAASFSALTKSLFESL
jgi:hypothetical protein